MTKNGNEVPIRRFRLADWAGLVVVLAVGFVLAKPFVEDFGRRLLSPDSTPGWWRRSGMVLGVTSRLAVVAMPWVLVARFLPPRPRRRAIGRQPGAVACAAGTAAMLAGTLIYGSLGLFRPVSISSADASFWPFMEARVPAAILASWVALALVVGWRAERSWVDRAGRLLGAYWILIWGYRTVGTLFYPLFWIAPR